MAAYCRVSTDQEEQLLSYENQVNYYTNYISENPLYEYAGTYADEGISGTNTKKRDEFNRMIADCRAGKIDMIITKSISRFARNTLDCLNYMRELKDLGIGIIFEKEDFYTLKMPINAVNTALSKGTWCLNLCDTVLRNTTINTLVTMRRSAQNCAVSHKIVQKQKSPCKARRFQELLLHMADELLLV